MVVEVPDWMGSQKRLPMVMPANNVDTAKELHKEFPGRIGVLMSPGNWKDPGDVPYVLDNGRFSARHGGKWNAREFKRLLDSASGFGRDPLWVVVPDRVGDAEKTIEDWGVWTKRLESYGWSLALAVQDGMDDSSVKGLSRRPDVVFVGGSTEWKWRTVRMWCREFDRVHVGRVATVRRLKIVEDCRAESSDSNVWRPIGRHLEVLRDYLRRSEEGTLDEEGLGF